MGKLECKYRHGTSTPFRTLFVLKRRSSVIELQWTNFDALKFRLKTIDLSTRLWGINLTDSVVIPRSLVLRFTVLG